uniref:lipopolysaccharide biosynthesis protein n=1 Tax=Ningiella ruwaisensis TaxID=2364274 RepID=UPI001F501298|nr:lipopolysaccharide biosynthesis protein [Ningiella ruwaisensis]
MTKDEKDTQKMNQQQDKNSRLLKKSKKLHSDTNKYAIKIKKILAKRPLFYFVLLPFLCFFVYQALIASPRYESQAKLIVETPDSASTLDPTMALLSGFGVSSDSPDVQLLKAFIHSNDMLNHLEQKLSLREHFSDNEFDLISRLSKDASQEDFLSYYKNRVKVEIDDQSNILLVAVQAYEPDMAHKISVEIVSHAEIFINNISQMLAEEQLKFVKNEYALIDDRLKKAKANLLAFQREYNLLDPQAEGMAFQQITYALESQIASKRAQLRSLRSSMSENAPLVLQAAAELESLEQQLLDERSRLTSEDLDESGSSVNARDLSVSQIMAQFSDYRIDLELALQAYTSSQVSLEKARIEAYRQIKYLVTVESPTFPEEAAFPKVFFNVSLFVVINLMLFGIAKILLATVKELKR